MDTLAFVVILLLLGATAAAIGWVGLAWLTIGFTTWVRGVAVIVALIGCVALFMSLVRHLNVSSASAGDWSEVTGARQTPDGVFVFAAGRTIPTDVLDRLPPAGVIRVLEAISPSDDPG